MAAWVSLRVRSTSTFMVYLKSLVLSDILETLMIPFDIYQTLHTRATAFHMFHCRFLGPIRYTCMYISISLTALISLDRFIKIVQPCGQTLCQNLRFGRLMSASIYVMLTATSCLPTMVLTNRRHNTSDPVSSCAVYKGAPGRHLHQTTLITLNLYFWLLCAMVVACYMGISRTVLQSFRNSGSSNSQAKQRTKLRVFLVLVVFLVSFSPYHLVRISYIFQQTSRVVSCADHWRTYAKGISLWIATTNVCLNPILYFFLCREFSEKLKSVIQGAGDCVLKNRSGGTAPKG
ncbi:unnamed protein product [Merluccius merluccius]